jgi:hypothetical protein
MAKIISLLRKNGGVAAVPALVVVGQPIADGGAVVDEIKYFKHESGLLAGPHYEVVFKEANTRIVIPLSAVLEVLFEVEKKEKVKVPSLE